MQQQQQQQERAPATALSETAIRLRRELRGERGPLPGTVRSVAPASLAVDAPPLMTAQQALQAEQRRAQQLEAQLRELGPTSSIIGRSGMTAEHGSRAQSGTSHRQSPLPRRSPEEGADDDSALSSAPRRSPDERPSWDAVAEAITGRPRSTHRSESPEAAELERLMGNRRHASKPGSSTATGSSSQPISAAELLASLEATETQERQALQASHSSVSVAMTQRGDLAPGRRSSDAPAHPFTPGDSALRLQHLEMSKVVAMQDKGAATASTTAGLANGSFATRPQAPSRAPSDPRGATTLLHDPPSTARPTASEVKPFAHMRDMSHQVSPSSLLSSSGLEDAGSRPDTLVPSTSGPSTAGGGGVVPAARALTAEVLVAQLESQLTQARGQLQRSRADASHAVTEALRSKQEAVRQRTLRQRAEARFSDALSVLREAARRSADAAAQFGGHLMQPGNDTGGRRDDDSRAPPTSSTTATTRSTQLGAAAAAAAAARSSGYVTVGDPTDSPGEPSSPAADGSSVDLSVNVTGIGASLSLSLLTLISRLAELSDECSRLQGQVEEATAAYASASQQAAHEHQLREAAELEAAAAMERARATAARAAESESREDTMAARLREAQESSADLWRLAGEASALRRRVADAERAAADAESRLGVERRARAVAEEVARRRAGSSSGASIVAGSVSGIHAGAVDHHSASLLDIDEQHSAISGSPVQSALSPGSDLLTGSLSYADGYHQLRGPVGSSPAGKAYARGEFASTYSTTTASGAAIGRAPASVASAADVSSSGNGGGLEDSQPGAAASLSGRWTPVSGTLGSYGGMTGELASAAASMAGVSIAGGPPQLASRSLHGSGEATRWVSPSQPAPWTRGVSSRSYAQQHRVSSPSSARWLSHSPARSGSPPGTGRGGQTRPTDLRPSASAGEVSSSSTTSLAGLGLDSPTLRAALGSLATAPNNNVMQDMEDATSAGDDSAPAAPRAPSSAPAGGARRFEAFSRDEGDSANAGLLA